MAEKTLKSRIVHKHDSAENWAKAINFIPKQGEIIVYDKDSTNSYERFKIGDGVTNVNSLPFADEQKLDKTTFQQLVGDTSVSEQINTALSTKQNILTAGHNITIEEDTISAVDELPKISISGKNWTQSNITNDDFRSVYYGNDIWVAASYNNGLYYSTDGIIWTKSNIAQTGFQCVYCSNGIWVAGSATGKGLYYSTNGMTWTQSNITDGIFQSIYYGNNIWVAASSLASTANNIGLYLSLIHI